MMRDFNEILLDVKSRIAKACERSGRKIDEVEIIAVTKTHGTETVDEAWRHGLTIMGENKVQEALWKKPASQSGPMWHLIGHLQTNKVRQALEIFDYIHSLDSIKLADRIQFIAEQLGVEAKALLEVNVSGEKSKSGMKETDVIPTLNHIAEHCPRITVEGFMTMAPFSENPEDARPYFRRLKSLRDNAEKELGIGLPRLSMGMSGDFEVAVEEGATWLRLGTILFGDRPKTRMMRRESDEDFSSSFGGLDSYSGEGETVKILD
jgi:pyridoxal phosphate enzyme (YggS family)